MMEAVMAQVLVRNLDDAVVEELKHKAQSRGLSLEEQLRRIITEAASPTRTEMDRLMASCRAMTPDGPRDLAEDLIREDRDAR
jgi:plasmid stability protein